MDDYQSDDMKVYTHSKIGAFAPEFLERGNTKHEGR